MAVIPKTGDWVVWQWFGSIAQGEVINVVAERSEIESAGKRIVRNGTPDNPAVIIRHKSGNNVLKLASELKPTQNQD